jgi:hypothetical protein
VRAVARSFERGIDARQRRRRDERAQQVVVARSRLVRAADDRIDRREARRGAEPVVGDARAGFEPARLRRRVLERARDGGADRDDPAAALLCRANRGDGAGRNAVGLVERQARIECGVAGRRQTGGVGQRRKADASLLEPIEQSPVEDESGRRRLVRDRQCGDPRPDVPERERRGEMRVLHRPSVACDAGADRVRIAGEVQLDEARMVE